jgi:putative spermidine/putrescine transport system permease protein
MPGTETLPMRTFLYIQDTIDALVALVSACVLGLTVAMLVVMDRLFELQRLLLGRADDRG